MIKKRKRLITLVSSILTCTALCGLFALSSFRSKKQEETKADGQSVYYRGGYNGSLSISNGVLSGFNFSLSGNFVYNKVYQSGVEKYQYQFNFNFTLYDTNVTPNVSYPLYIDSDLLNTNYEYYSPLISGLDTHLKIRLDYLTMAGSANSRFQLGFIINTTNLNYQTSSNPLPVFYSNYSASTTASYDFTYDNVLVDMDFTPYAENQYDDGYNQGYTDGYNSGYNQGNINGYNQGYEQGVQAGKIEQSQIDENLISASYADGYSAGYQQGQSQDSTVTSIFNGITTVALVPVKFFLNIFNFEILGVNIASVVSALMSICLILIVWRAVMGGKSND